MITGKRDMNMLFISKMDDYLVNALSRLRGTGIRLTHVTAMEKYKGCLEGVNVINIRDLDDPAFYERENRSSPYSLSEEMLMGLQECQNLFMDASDRVTFFDISVRKRKMIYLDMALYWYTCLKQNGIDCVLFFNSPRMAWDIVLYFVAKYLGVKVLMMERTSIDNAMLFREDYKETERIPEDFLQGKTRDEIIGILGKDYYERVMRESYWVGFAKDKIRKLQQSNRSMHQAKNILKILGSSLDIRKYTRKRYESAFIFNGLVKNHVFFRSHFIKTFYDRRLLRYYESLAQMPDYDSKYIYFALQFQPERTSVPLGGVFENQVLALEILSKSIPEDWKILVKEHPRQLKAPRMSCLHYRYREYYDRIGKIPKVVFVDLDTDSKELIKHAQTVATLTGTGGWEAMVAGKACIAFGFPWYRECGNCFKVGSIESCREAVDQIRRKSAADLELDFLKYLAFFKDKFFHTVNRHCFAIRSDMEYDTLAKNLADAIITVLTDDTAKTGKQEALVDG